jgi:hypothetical protein
MIQSESDVLNQKLEQMKAQIEIAVRCLHVIAIMTEIDNAQTADMALNALRDMEISGLLYDFYENEDQ